MIKPQGGWLGMLLTIHGVGWFLLLGSVAAHPNHLQGGGLPPLIGVAHNFYDGALETRPGAQGFTYLSNPIFGAAATQTVVDGGTILDTTPVRAESAGYFLNPQDAPAFDPGAGFQIHVRAQLLAEAHNTPHRAGFSIIVLGTDARGIELGFWEGEIWAQEGGSGPTLFTHAEGVAFDTTARVVTYSVAILGDRYLLTADGIPLLTGAVRDYRAFQGFPDPYETPNLLFLGDDSGSAQARVHLFEIGAVIADTLGPQRVMQGEPLTIQGLGLIDVDGGTAPLSLTLSVEAGAVHVAADVPDGVAPAEIIGNGSAVVTLRGSAQALNRTLAPPHGVRYQAPPGFYGPDTLRITARDLGAGATGGTSQQDIPIAVTRRPGPDLVLQKQVAPPRVFPGEALTYTLTISNTGTEPARGALLAEPLPQGVLVTTISSQGVVITPTSGPLWPLADLAPDTGGVITISGVVSAALLGGITITNSATLTVSAESNPSDNHAHAPLVVLRTPDVVAPPGVDLFDVVALADRWHQHTSTPTWDPRFDLDGDGTITTADVMGAVWAIGRPPP